MTSEDLALFNGHMSIADLLWEAAGRGTRNLGKVLVGASVAGNGPRVIDLIEQGVDVNFVGDVSKDCRVAGRASLGVGQSAGESVGAQQQAFF